MFESIRPPDAAARFRSAALAPFASFLFAEAYLTFYPMLERVPPWLFWSVVAALSVGTAAGIVQVARVIRATRGERDARTAGWCAIAIVSCLLSARVLAGMCLPWLA